MNKLKKMGLKILILQKKNYQNYIQKYLINQKQDKNNNLFFFLCNIKNTLNKVLYKKHMFGIILLGTFNSWVGPNSKWKEAIK